MTEFAKTPHTTLRRGAARGTHDRATIEAILDEAFLCHVAFSSGDRTYCIPMAYARIADSIYLHGSAANHALCALRDGARACVTVTLLDGLVLGRSAFRQSVNYRSVVVFAHASEVSDASEKRAALRAIVEGVIPRRWADVRQPDENELRTTLVLRLPLVEVSAKVRVGPPNDFEHDYSWPSWAGVVPLRLVADTPIADPRLADGIEPPEYALEYRRPTTLIRDV